MRRVSLARQHYEQVMAKKSEKKTADGNLKTGSAYERMMIQLRNDLQRLKSIQSMERKNQVKEEKDAIYMNPNSDEKDYSRAADLEELFGQLGG